MNNTAATTTAKIIRRSEEFSYCLAEVVTTTDLYRHAGDLLIVSVVDAADAEDIELLSIDTATAEGEYLYVFLEGVAYLDEDFESRCWELAEEFRSMI